MKHSKKHPGFDKVASEMARKQGISEDKAKAELAASSRDSSAAARRHNPRLLRVKK